MCAVSHLFGQGLVVRRSAAGCGGDVEVFQFQAVITARGGGLAGEAGFVEDGIQEAAGDVAGKGTAGAGGTVGAGSESEDKDAGLRVAKTGNRLAPVVPVAVSAPFLAGDLLAIGH